jgi:hypothetical protein
MKGFSGVAFSCLFLIFIITRVGWAGNTKNREGYTIKTAATVKAMMKVATATIPMAVAMTAVAEAETVVKEAAAATPVTMIAVT